MISFSTVMMIVSKSLSSKSDACVSSEMLSGDFASLNEPCLLVSLYSSCLFVVYFSFFDILGAFLTLEEQSLSGLADS